jgi:hypothetical protein
LAIAIIRIAAVTTSQRWPTELGSHLRLCVFTIGDDQNPNIKSIGFACTPSKKELTGSHDVILENWHDTGILQYQFTFSRWTNAIQTDSQQRSSTPAHIRLHQLVRIAPIVPSAMIELGFNNMRRIYYGEPSPTTRELMNATVTGDRAFFSKNTTQRNKAVSIGGLGPPRFVQCHSERTNFVKTFDAYKDKILECGSVTVGDKVVKLVKARKRAEDALSNNPKDRISCKTPSWASQVAIGFIYEHLVEPTRQQAITLQLQRELDALISQADKQDYLIDDLENFEF